MNTPPDLIGRINRLLRAVGEHEPQGASTSVLARDTGLPRATTHRLLVALHSEGIVDRDRAVASWTLGPELYHLGLAAQRRHDVRPVVQPLVRLLAQRTGESASYSARRGNETVCLVHEEGSFPIRSHVLFEGARFPLGVVSAGLVILAYLPDRAIDSYLSRTDLEERFGESHAPGSVRERIGQVRREGWALNPGLVVQDSWGMAAAVFDSDRNPVGALTVTGIEHRFASDRRAEIGAALLDSAHRASQQLQRINENY